MSQYQDQERIAQEARSDAELRQSHFENRLKDVDDDIVQNAKKYVPEMLKWEKELGLEIGTVETLINVYGEDAYQIMYQAQNDPDYFQNMMPTRLRSTVNTLNQKASIIRVFRDNSLNNAEKINCFSNGPKYKFDRNTAQGIINNTRNEQKLQYGLTNKASLDELKAVQAYTRAFQYCKDHGYKYITDNNLIY